MGNVCDARMSKITFTGYATVQENGDAIFKRGRDGKLAIWILNILSRRKRSSSLTSAASPSSMFRRLQKSHYEIDGLATFNVSASWRRGDREELGLCRTQPPTTFWDQRGLTLFREGWVTFALWNRPPGEQKHENTQAEHTPTAFPAVQTDLRILSSQTDVVHTGAVRSKVLRDVDGEVLNVGKTSDSAHDNRETPQFETKAFKNPR